MTDSSTASRPVEIARQALPFWALLALWALGLRHLGAASLWYDELFNADLVLNHNWGQLLHVLQTDQPYPPLYPLLLKAWTLLVGAQPYAPGLEPANGLEELLRFPSLAAALLGVAVLAALSRRLRLRGGALVPLLLAVHPLTLWYARDVRLYAMLTTCLLLALLALLSGRRALWIAAAAAALLTHYFALFPLTGAAVGWLLCRRRSPTSRLTWWALGLPFAAAGAWGLWALPVTTGFSSFATASPPSLAVLLHESGPNLLTARAVLLPIAAALEPQWGLALLAAGALGLLLAAVERPFHGGPLALAGIGGLLGLYAFWQLRPVYHVRYLAWALPLFLVGLVAIAEVIPARRAGRWLSAALLALLALGGTAWGASRSLTWIDADPTTWYPDFRQAVAMMNQRAQDDDRGLAVAGHGTQVLTAYRSPVPLAAGTAIGDRLQPATAAALLDGHRPGGAGRYWLLLYQDDAVDPSGLLMGTLEAAGGYRSEMFYSREARVFAYTLPATATLQPLMPALPVEATFVPGLQLHGAAIHREDRLLPVYLFWKLTTPLPDALVVTVQIVRRVGDPPLVQQDQPLLNNYWPVTQLPLDETLPSRYELILPPDLPPGTYVIQAAVYQRRDGTRLPLESGGDIVRVGELNWP